MKQLIFMVLLMVGMVQSSSAQSWLGKSSSSSGYSSTQSTQATLTIANRSDYKLTVKVLKTGGRGLYTTVSISPRSSRTVSFSRSDSFYTKTKAVKDGILGETLYRKGSSFSVQCDSRGYTTGTLEFYVSQGRGSSGTGISKSEFEKDI